MHIVRQSWGGYLAYCDGCIEAWLKRADPPPALRDHARHVAGDGPPWCVHCHACGRRISAHNACPRCPCPPWQWLATHRAAVFGAALGRRLGHVTDIDLVWAIGHELCDAGFAPDSAADLAVQLED